MNELCASVPLAPKRSRGKATASARRGSSGSKGGIKGGFPMYLQALSDIAEDNSGAVFLGVSLLLWLLLRPRPGARTGARAAGWQQWFSRRSDGTRSESAREVWPSSTVIGSNSSGISGGLLWQGQGNRLGSE